MPGLPRPCQALPSRSVIIFLLLLGLSVHPSQQYTTFAANRHARQAVGQGTHAHDQTNAQHHAQATGPARGRQLQQQGEEQQQGAEPDTQPQTGSTDESAPSFHFHRYHPQDISVVKTGNGYYSQMRMHNQSYVHAVEELASRPVCQQLTFDSSLAGKFYLEPLSKHYIWELDACRLRRLDAAQTKACLKNKRVVMLGDSVTRYQYTSLVHFLASGYYQNPYDDGARSVSNVDHWGHNYASLYTGVTKLVLEFLKDGGAMSCDCDKSKAREDWLFSIRDPPVTVDYSYVYRWPSWSEAGNNALNWAMGQALSGGLPVDAPSAGKRYLNAAAHQQVVTGPGWQGESRQRSGSGWDGGGRVLARKKTNKSKNNGKKGDFPEPHTRPQPDVVVLNMCAWWGKKSKDALMKHSADIFKHGKALMDWLNADLGSGTGAGGSSKSNSSSAGGGGAALGRRRLQLVWKSCTTKDEWWDDVSAKQDQMARDYGWAVLDVRQIVLAARRQGLMITWNPSTVHFLQLAYENMNDMLLNVLCPVEADGEGEGSVAAGTQGTL